VVRSVVVEGNPSSLAVAVEGYQHSRKTEIVVKQIIVCSRLLGAIDLMACPWDAL